MTDKLQNYINDLVEEFNLNGQKKFKLIILFGLLGDFDSFEYAINLKNFIDNNQDKNLDIFAIAIGNQNGKEKFCKFTGCLLYTSPSPRDLYRSRMPSSA